MRFASEQLDASGLYHLRARQYDPNTGRFTARDPLTPAINDPYVSAYVYGNDRPTAMVDPTGERALVGNLSDDQKLVAIVVAACEANPEACGAAGSAAAGYEIGTAICADDRCQEAGGDLYDLLGTDEERRANSVALDTDPIIGALYEGQLGRVEKAIHGRAPVVSPTAEREYLVKGDLNLLMVFLGSHGGHIGLDGTPGGANVLQSAASRRGRSLRRNDAFIAHAAMREGVPLITNDRRFANFLRDIEYPVEGW
jgi:RHS repeat-associated protein